MMIEPMGIRGRKKGNEELRGGRRRGRGPIVRRGVLRLAFSAAVVVSVLAVDPVAAEVRQWKDSSGSFSVQAEFVAVRGPDVVLRRTTGKTLSVPLARLSEVDREFVEKNRRRLDGGKGNTGSAAPPTARGSAEERIAAAEKALGLLSRHIGEERGLDHPSGNTGECVVYATAGLAFLAHGPEYKSAARKVYQHLEEHLFDPPINDDPKWNQWLRRWPPGGVAF